MTYPIHDVANIFPEMGAAEFDALCADIAANGLREAPWLYQGAVIGGTSASRSGSWWRQNWRPQNTAGTESKAQTCALKLRTRKPPNCST